TGPRPPRRGRVVGAHRPGRGPPPRFAEVRHPAGAARGRGLRLRRPADRRTVRTGRPRGPGAGAGAGGPADRLGPDPGEGGRRDALDLALYRASYVGPVPTFPEPPAGAVIGGDVVALAVVVSAAVAAGRTRRRQG